MQMSETRSIVGSEIETQLFPALSIERLGINDNPKKAMVLTNKHTPSHYIQRAQRSKGKQKILKDERVFCTWFITLILGSLGIYTIIIQLLL